MKRKNPKLELVTNNLRQRIVSEQVKVGEMLPTESELAKSFGCSRGTVGKALDRLVQQGLVARKTRVGTRVVSLTPKTPMPSLHAFGFIHPSEQHEHIWEAIRGFSEAAEEAGRRTVAISFNNDEEKEFEILRHLGDQMLEAVAFYPVIRSPAMAARLIEASEHSNTAMVFVCLAAASIDRPMVGIDGFDAGLSVTSSLIKHGAKRIGYIGNNGWTLIGRDRVQGFRRALKQGGIEWNEDYIHLDYPTRANFSDPTQEGFEICTEFLQRYPELNGLICTDAFLGIGCLHAAREMGLSVPEDLRIGILDHNTLCELPDSTVTAYKVNHRQIGRNAFKVLDDMVSGKQNLKSVKEVLQTGQLVECGTVTKARKRMATKTA